MKRKLSTCPLQEGNLCYRFRFQPQCRMPDYAACIWDSNRATCNFVGMFLISCGIVRRVRGSRERLRLGVWFESPDRGAHPEHEPTAPR
jgi:hypothetical protein